MTNIELIEDYKQQAEIISKIDYIDKKSVVVNNKAVNRMYKIVNTLVSTDGGKEFSLLLNLQKDNVNLWAAIHMLEKMTVDNDTQEKALLIIRNASVKDTAGAMGLRYWLKEWEKANKKN